MFANVAIVLTTLCESNILNPVYCYFTIVCITTGSFNNTADNAVKGLQLQFKHNLNIANTSITNS